MTVTSGGGGGRLYGYKVISPQLISELEFDKVLIALCARTKRGAESVCGIISQLCDLGIDKERILLMRDDDGANESTLTHKFPRVQFLYDWGRRVNNDKVIGAVAECGVCWGDYAYHINKVFHNRKLYLFDTFECFPQDDIQKEEAVVSQRLQSVNNAIVLNSDFVYFKMEHRGNDNLVIVKGYIPNSLSAVNNHERFIYVHLDTDMYAPTVSALHFFAKRMVPGGIIVVHDYNPGVDGDVCWPGVEKAVDEFLSVEKHQALPMGDGSSIILLF